MSWAKLSETIVFAGIAKDGDYLLGYQNKATSLSREDKANAMIIPVPSKEKLGPKNVFDLSQDKSLFKSIADHLWPSRLTRSRSYSLSLTKGASIFKSGNYIVITADHSLLLPEAISQLPAHLRPSFSEDVANAYYSWYPETTWKMSLFIWEGKDEMQSDPVLMKFSPSDQENLFLPGLDAHNGHRPNLKNTVTRDHTLIIGAQSLTSKTAVISHIQNQEVSSWFPEYFHGLRVSGIDDANCDWVVSTKSLKQNTVAMSRWFPAYFEI